MKTKCGCAKTNDHECAQDQYRNGLITTLEDAEFCPCVCHGAATRRARRLKLKPQEKEKTQ